MNRKQTENNYVKEYIITEENLCTGQVRWGQPLTKHSAIIYSDIANSRYPDIVFKVVELLYIRILPESMYSTRGRITFK